MWQIDQYRLRLENRIKVKSVARDYNLVAPCPSTSQQEESNQTNGNSNQRKTGIKQQDQIKTSPLVSDIFSDSNVTFLRSFSRYISADCMEKLIRDLNGIFTIFILKSFLSFLLSYPEEKALKEKLKELNSLKKSGVKKLKDSKLAGGRKSTENGNHKMIGSVHDLLSSVNGRSRSSRKSNSSPAFDESDLADVMTDKERRLCHQMKMAYKTYFSVKTAILKDYLARRRGCPVKLRYPAGLDPNHRRKIVSLMVDNGWLDADVL